LAALGFLTLGRRFLGNMHDIIDDRIDVVARGTMALTVTCARCHNHKFDPIPTADYYSLYGVFASCSEKELPLGAAPAEFQKELDTREQEYSQFLQTTLGETRHRLRSQVGDYLIAAHQSRQQPDTQDFMFVENPGDLNRFVLGRWWNFLDRTGKSFHPVLAPWHVFAKLTDGDFAAQAPALATQLANNADPQKKLNPLVANLLAASPPSTLADLAQRYTRLFADIENQWQAALQTAQS